MEKADTIETLINEFNDPSIACSYGRQIAKDNTDPIEMFTRNFNYPEKSAIKSKDLIRRMGIKTVFCSNSFGAYRKFVLLDVGNFPENIIFGEDMYVAGKIILAGYKVAYVAEACVYHSHNNTLIQEFKRNFDIGVFHTREKWLLENFSFTNKEGYKFVFSLFKYSSIKRPFWFIKAVLYVFCRFIAYNLGRREKIIPICLKKKLCMSKYYWN